MSSFKIPDWLWPNYDDWSDFRFTNPGSHELYLPYHPYHIYPIVAVIFYVLSTYSTEWILRKINFQPMKLKWLSFFHNLFLSAFSFFIFFAIVWDLLLLYLKYDFTTMFCDSEAKGAQGRIVYFYYVFYLSKIYEFVDTFLLIFKRKPVIFLHRYHHFITLIMAYINLAAETSPQWVIILPNAMVHIIMYYYYALTTLGFQPSWKKWVTRIQITQFVFDLLMGVIGFLDAYAHNWDCAGGMTLWIIDIIIIASFLQLFVDFFKKTYEENSDRKKRHSNKSQ